MSRALGMVLCIVLLGSWESVAGQQEVTPQESVSVDASRADGKEILYLIPTGNDSSKTRAYLKQLCGWITRTEEIRSRYSIVYVSSHLERPLDEARAELSEGTELRRPQEKKPDNSRAGVSGSASEPSKLSAEDQELLRRIDSAQQLLSGTGPLWDVRGRLSECYSAQNESAAGTRTQPLRSTVLIAEYVDLGSHGAGLSFVKLSSRPGEKAHYDFVQLSGAKDLSDAVRLLAAAALRPKGMTAAKVEIKAHIQEQDRCPSSSGQDCLLQTGSARITISAKDSPFVRAGQVELPTISKEHFGEVPLGHIVITDTVSAKGRVEVTVHFRKSGTYRLRIPVRTQISASEEVTDVFDHIFEAKPQSIIMDEQTWKTAEYSEQLWGDSAFERLWKKPSPAGLGLSNSLLTRWRVMPAADFVALAGRIHGQLMKLDPPQADAGFGPEWKRLLDEELHHDAIRSLLELKRLVQKSREVLIPREIDWCSRLASGMAQSISRDRPEFVTTASGMDGWIKGCHKWLSEELGPAMSKIHGYGRIQRLRLRYNGDSPRNFRIIKALANKELAELQSSELVLSEIPLTASQIEELQLTALTPETTSVPVPVWLDVYTPRFVQFSLEFGAKFEKREGYYASSTLFYAGMRVTAPILKEFVGPSLRLIAFPGYDAAAKFDGIIFPSEKVGYGPTGEILLGAAIYPLALLRVLEPTINGSRLWVWDITFDYSLHRNDFCMGAMVAYTGGRANFLGLNMQTSFSENRSFLGGSLGFRY